MTVTYMANYQGKRYTLAELRQLEVWKGLEHEMQDRFLAMMTTSIKEGHPVGVGGTIRRPPRQEQLFKSRHHVVSSGGCCYYKGQRYQVNANTAHAAPPDLSYHEEVPPMLQALAIDAIGDMQWQMANCTRFALIHFGNVNGEPWHLQPSEIPHSRRQYIAKIHYPLQDRWPSSIELPPKPSVPFVIVPDGTPPMRVTTPQRTGKDVADLQQIMTFWKWFAGTCDGAYGPQTAAGVTKMQQFFHDNFNKAIVVDGIYGEQSEAAYRQFADGVSRIAGG